MKCCEHRAKASEFSWQTQRGFPACCSSARALGEGGVGVGTGRGALMCVHVYARELTYLSGTC